MALRPFHFLNPMIHSQTHTLNGWPGHRLVKIGLATRPSIAKWQFQNSILFFLRVWVKLVALLKGICSPALCCSCTPPRIRCLVVSAAHVFTCAFDLPNVVTVLIVALCCANMIKIPPNTNLDRLTKTGRYLQLRSFTFFALHNLYSGPF